MATPFNSFKLLSCVAPLFSHERVMNSQAMWACLVFACRGQEICEQVRELCVKLLSVSSGIFKSRAFYSTPLSVEGAIVPVLLFPMGGTSFSGELLSRFRRSGCIYRRTSFSNLPSHKLTLTGSVTTQPLKDQHLLSGVFPRKGIFLGQSANGAVLMGGGKKGAACGSCPLLRDRAVQHSHLVCRAHISTAPSCWHKTCPPGHPESSHLGRDFPEDQISHCFSS